MDYLQVINERTGALLGDRIQVADQWWARLRGLLGRPQIGSGEGLLLAPCRAVHMLGMRYPLDVALLNESGEVVALYEALPPGGRTRWHRDACQTLELPAGTLRASGTSLGDTLAMLPRKAHAPSGSLTKEAAA